MIVHVNTFGLSGIKGFFVDAEINLAKGLPYFDIIGMGNIAVKEAADRIKPAIENIGYKFPLGRITVNLAPASIRKEGAHFDLAIAVGILKCAGYIKSKIEKYAFIGELSLDGVLRPVKGIMPMIQSAAQSGIYKCIVPLENADEAALVNNCKIFPAATLNEVLYITENSRNPWRICENNLHNNVSFGDFIDVKGQKEAIRAAEIAAAGGHNILFIGAPGCGKTMIASRIPSIMPKLSIEESMEITPIYSVLGMLGKEGMLIRNLPFRTVYPDVTKAGLIGGGNRPVPGEISLAHKGILFLDELAEFDRNVIQSLRQPMETGKVLISRCGDFVEFPSDFMLVASTNPCKCGKLLEGNGRCSCTPYQAKQYLSKISKPLLDRIDIHVPVRQVCFNSEKSNETSSIIRERVIAAREKQKKRFAGTDIHLNGKMTGKQIREYCQITTECELLLKSAADLAESSMRGYEKFIKIGRTIADLDGRENIDEEDIAEALQYRFLDSFRPEVAV